MNNTFSFNLLRDENGYAYYDIPEGTILYRGDTNLYPNFQAPNGPAFFSTMPKFVKHYGLMFTFETTAPLKLIALDTKGDYATFYTNAPANIREILDRNYGRTSGQRDSVYDQDYKLVNYLCGLGFDGYANDRMEVTFDSVVDMYEGEEEEENRKFHPEMAICDTTKLRFVDPAIDMARYTQSEIDRALRKKQEDKQKRELDEQRKKKSHKRNPRYHDRESMDVNVGVPFMINSGLVHTNNHISPMSSPTPKKTLFDDEGSTTSDSAGSDVSAPSTPPRALSFESILANSMSSTPPKRQKTTYNGGKRTRKGHMSKKRKIKVTAKRGADRSLSVASRRRKPVNARSHKITRRRHKKSKRQKRTMHK